ncbi:hypothetical protein ACVNPS_00845 [Candidatus Bipolaricaulota sp. J31]
MILMISAGKRRYPVLPKAAFPEAMPRYPNLWFYVERGRASSYEDAVSTVLALLERCGLYEITWRPPLEGADGEMVRDHLQPHDGFSSPALFHEHALHLRYYLEPLREKLWEVRDDKPSLCWAIAASVHFEPSGRVHYLPLDEYPELMACPFCGPVDEGIPPNEIYERVRDPLGLELLLEGRIRGMRVKDAFRREAHGIRDLDGAELGGMEIEIAESAEAATPRLGFVVIS